MYAPGHNPALLDGISQLSQQAAERTGRDGLEKYRQSQAACVQPRGHPGRRAEADVVTGELTSPAAAARAGELLANLTEHDVVLVVRPRREGDSAEESSLTRILPDGRFARVDDEVARIRERLIDTASGVVRLSWLRRSDRLVDLPAPKVGTRFVVSRVTALAARDRGDLVFPFGEIRDEHGRVTGVQGLASFRPRPAIWRLPAAWRAAVRERRRAGRWTSRR